MASISISHARAELSRLIERALAGEGIVITRRGKPAVRLVPVEQRPRRRKPGALKGLFEALGYRYLRTNYIDHYFTNIAGIE